MKMSIYFAFERWNVSQSICLTRPSENMLIRANTDGTYSANWTPGAVGLYTIHVTIDGIEIGKSLFDIVCYNNILIQSLKCPDVQIFTWYSLFMMA